MIAVIDYGAGNIFSIVNALDYIGCKSVLTCDRSVIEEADSVILPGVGAFPEAMRRLGEAGLIDTIRAQAGQKPLLGICLGMQALFEKGCEFEETDGLGLVPGEVRRLDTGGLKLPHMGWNSVRIDKECELTQGLRDGDMLYFVHSYAARTSDVYVSLSCEYGERFPALVHSGYVYGAQFHPEKSGPVGLRILRSFAALKK